MTAAMILADFRLDDMRPQSKALIRARVESLATYAANYHNSYEKLSSILHERTKALREAEGQVALLMAGRDAVIINLPKSTEP